MAALRLHDGCEVSLHFADRLLHELARQTLGGQVQALLVRSQRLILAALLVLACRGVQKVFVFCFESVLDLKQIVIILVFFLIS